VVSCDLDGEAAILNVQTGIYYGLEEAGAAVWRMVSAPRTVAEIIEGIISEYDVDAAQCRGDVLRLLGELAEHGLIEVADGSAG
jgi:hypothetical protein